MSSGASAAVRGDGLPLTRQITNVRWIVLHVIEETAAHSGHLEIARREPGSAVAEPPLAPRLPV
jgi:hypothetical protein